MIGHQTFTLQIVACEKEDTFASTSNVESVLALNDAPVPYHWHALAARLASRLDSLMGDVERTGASVHQSQADAVNKEVVRYIIVHSMLFCHHLRAQNLLYIHSNRAKQISKNLCHSFFMPPPSRDVLERIAF